MPTWHQETPEESTFDQVLSEGLESLSEAARAVLEQAHGAADKAWMAAAFYSYHPDEYEVDKEAISRAAAEITEEDLEGLTRVWRSALRAAASVDPYDYETLVGWRAYRG